MLVHTGTFDVENYGDLLFPMIVRRRLAGARTVHVSPAGGPAVWADTVACDPLDRAAGQPLDGVMIGGGNIIHPMPTMLPEYRRAGADLLGYADLWLVPSLAADDGLPIVWNAPGVPSYFETPFLPLVREALERADYLSVRDAESRAFLGELVQEREIAVVPDPAWELPAIWPAGDLAETRPALISGLGGDPDERYVVIHVNARYATDLSAEALAAEIDGLARALSARPVLVAIGPCHGDGETAYKVAATLSTPPLVLHAPRRIRDIAALISGAVAYAGSSMHGYITAAAYGVPAIAIARGKSKFDGLVRLTGAPETLMDSWTGVSDALCSHDHGALSARFQNVQRSAAGTLERHWTAIGQHLVTAGTAPAARRLDSQRIASTRTRVLGALSRHLQSRCVEKDELLRRAVGRRLPPPPPAGKGGEAGSMTELQSVLGTGTYDYVDFGCSKGGSLDYGRRVLGGQRGIGLDIAPSKIALTRAAGYEAAEVDVTRLASFPDCTRFVTMIDFLEHLPGIDLASKCINAACEAATDFVFIRQPWFDSDGYLFSQGLKLYWSDWTGHPNAMTTLELHNIVRKLEKPKRWRTYARTVIADSDDTAVHPLASPPDQNAYDPSLHGAKPTVHFSCPVYRQIGAIVLLKDDPDLLSEIEKKTKWTKVLYDSAKA